MNCQDCGEPLNAKERQAVHQAAQYATIGALDIQCDSCQRQFASRNREEDNGPTGHGDMCLSDADPGL